MNKISLDAFLFKSGISTGMAESRRLIKQGAVILNNKKIHDPKIEIINGDILNIGKQKKQIIVAANCFQ